MARIVLALFACVGFAAHAQAPTALELFVRADKGHCIACHQLPEGAGPPSRADFGPKLEGTRMRSLGRPKLRQRLEDATVDDPATVMPPFGRHRLLEPAEITQLVEFLHALP